MHGRLWIAVAAAAITLTRCASPEKKAGVSAPPPDEGARITQLYAARPAARGEKALVCYGVENAKTVWMEPPRRELSAALSRCVEVFPTADTTYKLTAEGPDGRQVTRELKVAVGAPRAKIVNVNVSALEVKAGELVSVCYTVEHARAVTIEPIGFRGGAAGKGCATDQPQEIEGVHDFGAWGRWGKGRSG